MTGNATMTRRRKEGRRFYFWVGTDGYGGPLQLQKISEDKSKIEQPIPRHLAIDLSAFAVRNCSPLQKKYNIC